MTASPEQPTGNDHGRWIEIDPNVRHEHNTTFTYVDPEFAATLEMGAAYVVGESEAGITWPATLLERTSDGYLRFYVAWSKWKKEKDV